MTAYEGPNMMMRLHKTKDEVMQEVVDDLRRITWAPAWEDIERLTAARMNLETEDEA